MNIRLDFKKSIAPTELINLCASYPVPLLIDVAIFGLQITVFPCFISGKWGADYTRGRIIHGSGLYTGADYT